MAHALRHDDRLHALLLHAEELFLRNARASAGLRNIEVDARDVLVLGRHRIRTVEVRERHRRRQGGAEEDAVLRAPRVHCRQRSVRICAADCGSVRLRHCGRGGCGDAARVDVRAASRPQPVLPGDWLPAVREAADAKPFTFASPVTFRAELMERCQPPITFGKPFMKRLDGRTYEVTAPTLEEAYFLH